jgi:hypothetical protein
MKKENNSEINTKKIQKNEEDDNKNINDLSDFTEKEVFKGGINNIEKKITENSITNKNQQSNIMNLPHNLLQNLIKQENSNNNTSFQPNNSISSSGFISFRNKKARFVNLNITNNTDNNKIEEEIDPKLITQSILIKLKTNGKINLTNSSFSKENQLIESTKENEVEIDEKDLKVIHTNSSNSNSIDDNNIEINEKNSEEEENEKNVFWNLNSNKDKNINENNFDNLKENKDNNFKEKNKEKYLNTIICTLSILEKGKAIFVSQDDMIFILPSFFVPKNLKIGNTYKFRVKEYFQYSKKSDEIQEIQQKYAK